MTTTPTPTETQDVLLRVHHGIGHITLNRPKAINALTHPMVRTISAALTNWAGEQDVKAVVIDGAGDRGLCAGGDIRAIYEDARSGGSASIDFWRDEYRLNAAIAHYRKPVVAVMDGLVMGGGVGLAAHASHRIVTDRSIVAMPEVNIGLVPDVGGSYLLARAPGWSGLHAALTGVRLTGADVLALGLADYYIEHGELQDFLQTMAVHGLDSAVFKFASTHPTSELMQQQWIDTCYQADTVTEILAQLSQMPGEPPLVAARAIKAASPSCVTVALRAIRSVRDQKFTLEQALNQEFRIVSAALRSADLIEGIRAQVIDKDRTPQWNPPHLADLPPGLEASYFAPVPDLPFPDHDHSTDSL